MALERWFHEVEQIPPMNTHIIGTPDVPDIIRPGDWICETDEIGDVYSIAIKIVMTKEDELDYCPGAKSWIIYHLGTGYMTGEKLSTHDCCFFTGIVAVDGELLPLYKLGWNEETKIKVCAKPNNIEVPEAVRSLIRRMNKPVLKDYQLSFL